MKIFHRNVSEFMPKLRRGSLLQMHIDEYFFKDESDLIESNKPINDIRFQIESKTIHHI
jgi:hypothetical protein